MTSKPYVLEQFDVNIGRESEAASVEKSDEGDKLAAFEKGYQAGWDDAAMAQQQDQTRVTVDLENSLKDLSFTYHEAKSHLLRDIEPLLKPIVSSIFPEYAHAVLPDLVAERLKDSLKDKAHRPVTISVSPESRDALEAAMPADPGLPLTIRTEETLGKGQVFIDMVSREETIDLDDAIASIHEKVSEFFEENRGKQ